MPEKRLVDTPKHGVFMENDLWDRIHKIALFFGFRLHSGQKVGKGNVHKLMNAIAVGDLEVCDPSRAQGPTNDPLCYTIGIDDE